MLKGQKQTKLNVQVGEHHGEEAVEPASEVQEEFSQASSPGPDMAAVSPLTPQVRLIEYIFLLFCQYTLQIDFMNCSF